mmetsp:Transcript_23233/g.32438  ORF Transcript_23233/g.32438 Transcript_23233/m.32438 type:complete len:162 (+) Transcript_23233:171-656(+)|eukprot:CAMPEP_0184487298 /NCGR_PEP_ID=MMETSP0113_2-20130426/9717_1 /TAXON_ID=91329 /ORGANISM="Norrisiella sphaerica, Strain BC52" /LENGTH=161 /DNA_ID=CAMNT_0026869547 /DNA_START=172 /DNA_END=657 /DNA_ORIENTATION=+
MAQQMDEKELIEKSKKWPAFYPNYINRLRTYAQGRKIKKEDCCDNPTAIEVAAIASALKLKFVIERFKLHPRAFKLKPGQVVLPGRVRVELWDENKEPINEKVKTRKEFMAFAGKNIPNLKIRHERIRQAQARIQAHQAAVEKAQSKKQKGKKKGKKGKRR